MDEMSRYLAWLDEERRYDRNTNLVTTAVIVIMFAAFWIGLRG